MSYEILYGRQFIDLGDGRYIPLVLSGSNNCTMFRNGREVLERHWWPFGPQLGKFALTKQELFDWISERAQESPDGEWFMRSGKWLLGSDMPRWIESGIKSARTIDEMVTRTGSLECYICIYNNEIPYGEKGHCRHEYTEFARSTEDLLKWLEIFDSVKSSKKENEEVYPSIAFMTLEPLKLGSKPKPNTPVVCKCGKHYLSQYEVGSGYTCSWDSDEAIIFDSEEDFRKKTAGLRIGNYRLIAPPKPKKDKAFVITVMDGPYAGEYVEKLSRSRLHFSRSSEYARRFTSEKEAERYIKERLEGRFSRAKEFAVIQTEKK